MKNLLVLCMLAAAPLCLAAENGQLTDAERVFLVDQLEQSKQHMLDSIAGLSPEQWRYKAAPDRWSIAQCAEHIVLSEDFIFGGAQKALGSPEVPRPEKSNAEVDKKIVAGVTDRSHKATAPEPLVPSGHFETPADAAQAFTEKRDKTIAYVKSTQDPLRVHVMQGPAGPMDAYQFLLLLAAHSARHTLQIEEVKQASGYPKATASGL